MPEKEPSYALGYGKGSVGWMASRHVGHQGAFFAQHLKAGMHLLDCGCGPGTLTCGFAEIIAPGPVTAIDIEPSQVATTAARAKDLGLANVTCRTASIYDLPFDDNSFDAVFVSAVLGNIAKPYDAVKEIYRVLKPGGVAGIREFDHAANMMYPTNPIFARSIELYLEMRRHSGNAENFGREVKSAMHQAGFHNIDAKGVYESYASETDVHAYAEGIIAIFEEMFGVNAIANGLTTQDEYDAMIKAWRDWPNDPGAFFTTAWVEALGWK